MIQSLHWKLSGVEIQGDIDGPILGLTMTTSESPEQAAARIAARYPRPRRTATVVTIGAVLVGLLAIWGVWAGLHRAQPGIHGQLYSYRVVSPSQVDVVLKVHRPDPSKAGVCTVQAQAPSGETVGELDVQLAPSNTTDQDVPATLKTYLKAHTAIITGCRLA